MQYRILQYIYILDMYLRATKIGFLRKIMFGQCKSILKKKNLQLRWVIELIRLNKLILF